MKNQLLSVALGLGLTSAGIQAHAQEVSYHTFQFPIDVPAQYELPGSAYKTFDVRVFATEGTSILQDLRKNSNTGQKYAVSFGNYQQVDGDSIKGDLHVVGVILQNSFISYYSNKGGIMDSKTDLFLSVQTADGKELYSEATVTDLHTSYAENTSKEDIPGLVWQNAVTTALAGFQKKVDGYKGSITLSLADMNKVKDKPELLEYDTHVQGLLKIIKKGDVEGFCEIAEKYLPAWEKQATTYAGENAEEVKRASYQNMAMYYLLKKNYAKAKEIVELYKPIDKIHKEMFGLVKFKNSEQIDSVMSLQRAEKIQVKAVAAKDRIQAKEALANTVFYKIEGTATVAYKKADSIYTGIFYMRNPKTYKESGNMMTIGAKDPGILLYKEGDTTNVAVTVYLSKVKSFQDKANKKYTVIKAAMGFGENSYYLMSESFASPKISMYRVAFPSTSYNTNAYLVRKSNDEEGVRTSMFNMKKNLSAYLADCTKAAEMVTNSQNLGDDIIKVMEAYTGCGQ